jgi:hypothetical protein
MQTGRIEVGHATVSWGPRVYGDPRIIANATVAAIDDLLEAVLQAHTIIVQQIESERENPENDNGPIDHTKSRC